MSNYQLAIFYSPSGEVVRLISYGSRAIARNNGERAMKWLNPDRFHFTVLEGHQRLPAEFVGVPPEQHSGSITEGRDA